MGDSAVFSLLLGDIVGAIGGELLGDARIAVEGLAPLDRAQSHQICFLSNPRYAAALPGCPAACVIVAPPMREAALARGTTIVAPDPYLYYAKLTQLWRRRYGAWRGDDAAGAGGAIRQADVLGQGSRRHDRVLAGPGDPPGDVAALAEPRAAHLDLAARQGREAEQQMQKTGLAGAAGAHHRHDLARRDVEVEPVDDRR